MNLKEKKETLQDKVKKISTYLLSTTLSSVKNLNEQKKKEWKA